MRGKKRWKLQGLQAKVPYHPSSNVTNTHARDKTKQMLSSHKGRHGLKIKGIIERTLDKREVQEIMNKTMNDKYLCAGAINVPG